MKIDFILSRDDSKSDISVVLFCRCISFFSLFLCVLNDFEIKNNKMKLLISIFNRVSLPQKSTVSTTSPEISFVFQ
jgi:hypothetical protein